MSRKSNTRVDAEKSVFISWFLTPRYYVPLPSFLHLRFRLRSHRTQRRIHAAFSFFAICSLVLTSLPASWGISSPASVAYAANAGADSGAAGKQVPPAPSSPIPATDTPGPEPTSTALVSPTSIPPTPQTRTVTPIVDPQLPSLAINMDMSSRALAVGDLFTVTATLNNESAYAANNVTITLPLPAGAEAYPTPRPQGWTWQVPYLDAGGSVLVTATMRLSQMPPGEAVLGTMQASAQGLTDTSYQTIGAVVVDRTLGSASESFVPGTAATLRSRDNRVEVQIPANASDQALTFRHSFEPGAGHVLPTDVAGRKHNMGVFYLSAINAYGTEVNQFNAPLTITVKYTPQQLQAMGIGEEDLTLFWFDESQFGRGRWIAVDSKVDPVSGTVTVQANHFSPWTLSDGSSPSAAFIPSLQGWQVGLFSGDVSYSYPIELPAGPGGIKPSLALSYSSSSTDGASGRRPKQQSSWVGKGWSLDTGYVALNRLASDTGRSRYFSLVFNGQSFDLMRGSLRAGIPITQANTLDPSHWEWKPTNESFIRAIAEPQGPSTPSRGGYFGNIYPYQRYYWKVWAKDGTRYEFSEDVWQGSKDCDNHIAYVEAYKWYLYRVVDTNRNVITYNYDRISQSVTAGCEGVRGVVDYAIWPTQILWGYNSTDPTSSNRYKVEFITTTRTIDNLVDSADNQLGPAPQEKAQLTAIKVWSMQSSTWELVRQYSLSYADGTTTPRIYTDDPHDGSSYSNYPKITLNKIEQLDNNPTNPTALPPLTFTYGTTRGNGYYPNGEWNRLETVNNGQGGTIQFYYQTIGERLCASQQYDYCTMFGNNRRVWKKEVTDGQGNTRAWEYEYFNPAYNTIGTQLGNSSEGPNQWPNAATVYYSMKWDPDQQVANDLKLVHRRKKQFLGHGRVVEKLPGTSGANGNQIEHKFYQGSVEDVQSGGNTCNYPGYPNAAVTGGQIENNACFQELRKRQFLKGKEYETTVYSATVGGSKLSQTSRAYTVDFLQNGHDSYADDRLTGLWRAFNYESSTVETTYDGGSTGLSKTTNSFYDKNNYGNLIWVEERDSSNALLRKTEYTYGTHITGGSYSTYIADRKLEENIKDGQGKWLAKTVYGYDGSNGGGNPGLNGRLTLIRKYFDIPHQTTLPTTISSSDTSYGYDTYGNQTSVTTYPNEGTLSTGTNVYSRPGGSNGGSEGRTSTTFYDSVFHAFPERFDNPPNEAGLVLRETAAYDKRMGLLTSVTDANSKTTSAEYDSFGRMVKLIKPGDSSTYPTLSMEYGNYSSQSSPFYYRVMRREVTGDDTKRRPITQFYNGIGQLIQTKGESAEGTQNIVADKQYDGLGRVTKESQPRYVSQSGTAFWAYVAPTDSGIRWTTTAYDGASRPTSVQAPDSTTTYISYTTELDTDGVRKHFKTTNDANNRRTQHVSDVFGRLVRVNEFNGVGAYTLYATTVYTYNPLDLLTGVQMANGQNTTNNVTTISYNSLGRKTSMSDATMGTWTYDYFKGNGNLKTQTDAKGQTITFQYDKLDRLIRKVYPGTNTYSYYKYDEPWSTNGKGRLSYTERSTNDLIVATSKKFYTDRGLESKAEYKVLGLTGTGSNCTTNGCRAYLYTYDAADRLVSMTYPNNEVVTYTYDAAWRQTSLCSDITGQNCYVSSSTYTALDQPDAFSFGNGTAQDYKYTNSSNPMNRLQELLVTGPGSTTLFNRTYTYDNVGNVSNITKPGSSPESQDFRYDDRDRLIEWLINSTSTATYSYDALGNLTSKGGVNYTYGTGNGGPHAVRSTSDGSSYQYDANGNMTSGAGRSFNWNVENQPTIITNTVSSITENYIYDADGARVKRVVTGGSSAGTTYYVGGMHEEEHLAGTTDTRTRNLYQFNGQAVAQNEWAPDVPPTATNTPVNTFTNTPTDTATPTYTPTYTNTPTSTPSDTPTASVCSVTDLPFYLHSTDRPSVNGGYLMDHGEPPPSTGRVTLDTTGSKKWSSPSYSYVDFASGNYELRVRVAPCPSTLDGFPEDPSKRGQGRGSSPNSREGSARAKAGESGASPETNITVRYKLEHVSLDGLNPTQIGSTVDKSYSPSCTAINDTVTFATNNATLTLQENRRLRVTAQIINGQTGDTADIYIGDSYLTTPSYTMGPCPTSTPTSTPTPCGVYHYFQPQSGAPASGGKIPVGQKFVLDLMVNPGTSTVAGQQVYLQYDAGLLQNVNASSDGCTLTNTVTLDSTVFDAQLQNEVCNGPGNCLFRGVTVKGGDINFASGVLNNSPYSGAPFRVAQVAFCASAPGETVLYWRFTPADPLTRDTQIENSLGLNVANQGCYADYHLIITGEPWTPTNTPLATNTPTNTGTPTNTPTYTNTPTNTPTATSPAVLVGHVAWEGPAAQPSSRQQLPITLTLKLGTTEANYTGLTTDAAGFFTVPVHTLPNDLYSWRVKGPRYLATSGTVDLKGDPEIQVEMGLQDAGDANNDNVVSSQDFTLLRNTFGKSQGDPGYDARADFNNDDVVNVSDFGLLRGNFGTGGSSPLRPGRVEGGTDSVRPEVPVSYAYAKQRTEGHFAQASASGSARAAFRYAPTKYTLNPAANAQRQQPAILGPNSPNVVRTLVYFHADHLGSISVASSSSGASLSSQEFDPWGKVRSGGVGQTKRNYTGQKLDDTGLLFYNARMYDSNLARFVSADSIVPGASLGSGGALGMVGAVQNSKLTVDFHETGLSSSINGENVQILQKGFWFQLSGRDREAAKDPWGPPNPQALNRYSYVLNNPLRYVDPFGHDPKTYQVVNRTSNGDLVQRLPGGVVRIALSGATLKLIAQTIGITPDPNVSAADAIKQILITLGMEAPYAAFIGVALAAAIAITADAIADNGNHLNLYFTSTGSYLGYSINGRNYPTVDPKYLIPAFNFIPGRDQGSSYPGNDGVNNQNRPTYNNCPYGDCGAQVNQDNCYNRNCYGDPPP